MPSRTIRATVTAFQRLFSSPCAHRIGNNRWTCHHRHFSKTAIPVTFDIDKFNGILVKIDAEPVIAPEKFYTALKESMDTWRKEKRVAVWLHVPIEQSGVIAEAAKQGFEFHHAEGNESVLCQWIKDGEPSGLPRFATHQVGVAGVVMKEETREVVVVQDRARKYTLWKFPGGLSELQEDISETAVREVYEETGLKTEFQSILTFRQQHDYPGAYGRSDIYFVCRMKPLSYELNPCNYEISHCEWMPMDILEKSPDTTSMTRSTIQILNHGFKHGFDKIDLERIELPSMYKVLKFNLFAPKNTVKYVE